MRLDMTDKRVSQTRVFVGLVEISGYYGRIVDSLRAEGYSISFWERSLHSYRYVAPQPRIDYPHQSYLRVASASKWSFLVSLRRRLFGVHFFVWSVLRHDVFVFACGSSFLKSGLDLHLLRLLGKRVVAFVAHGSELRPAFMDGAHWNNALNSADPLEQLRSVAKKQRRLARRLERVADTLIAHPLTSQFLTKKALCSSFIGQPLPAVARNNLPAREISAAVRIVHAPSDRRAKGSDIITAIIERLRTELDIVFVELSGVSNDVVLETLQQADIVVDQLYTDTRLSGFGAEAASLGVTVLTAGYGDGQLSKVIDESLLPPVIVAHPDEIEHHLRMLVSDVNHRLRAARELDDFLNGNWSLRDVARRFWIAVAETAPTEWYFDPNSVSYLHGSGLSEVELLAIAREGLARFGDGFLQLSQRPDLVRTMHKMLGERGDFP
jgi:hypothetical protein